MKNFLITNDSFLKALLFAKQIAKQTGGRIATMPDYAAMRAKNEPDKNVWNTWIVPATMMFMGTYKGKKLIVIAHHFGPLTTDERLLEWSKSGEKDDGSDREKYGVAGCPKITQDEFDSLVQKKYGDVKMIDFDQYFMLYKENLEGGCTTIDSASYDPLLRFLLSNNNEDYKLYLDKCFQISKAYAEEEKKEEGAAEKIIEFSVEDRYGASLFNKYAETVKFPEKPIGLMFLFQRPSCYSNHDLSVSTELHTNESLNYSQLLVLNDENEDLIKLEFNSQKHWKECLVPVEDEFTETFFPLVGEKQLFVEYPKKKDGSYMDSGTKMFPLKEIKKIGSPTTFKTDNCLFFLKYHIDEVRKLAPKDANAYAIIGDVEGRDNVTVPIQFYQVTPLTTRRILRPEEVMSNLGLLLKINNVLLPA